MKNSDKDRITASALTIMPVVAVSIEFGDEELVLEGLESKDEVLCFIAAQILYQTFRKRKITRALKPLIKALGDSSSAVRWAAAVALGELGDPRAVEPLAKQLKDELRPKAGNFCVRVAVANALGEIGHPLAVDRLIKHLDPDKEPHMFVRAAVARALGRIGDRRAFRPLLGCLEEESGIVLLAIAEALGNFDDRRAVEPLIKSLRNTRSVNRGAAASLGKLERHVTDEHVLELLYMLKNGHIYQLRAGCAYAIGELDRNGTMIYLKEAASKDTSLSVRLAVARVLKKTEHKAEALQILLKLLDDREKEVGDAAEDSIIEIAKCVLSSQDSTPVREPLSAALIALDDGERKSLAKETAEKCMELVGNLRIIEISENGGDKRMEKEAEEKSAFFGRELKKMEELAAIKKFLDEIESLEEEGGEHAIESLTGFLGSEDERVKKAASESLERLLKKENSPEVNAALEDDSCGDKVERIERAARKLFETGKTMMFDGKMFSRQHSPAAPQKPEKDTPKGGIKKTLV